MQCRIVCALAVLALTGCGAGSPAGGTGGGTVPPPSASGSVNATPGAGQVQVTGRAQLPTQRAWRVPEADRKRFAALSSYGKLRVQGGHRSCRPDTVTVSGEGFVPGSRVVIELARGDNSRTGLARGTADSKGRLKTRVTLTPPTKGYFGIQALGAEADGGDLTLTAGPYSPPRCPAPAPAR